MTYVLLHQPFQLQEGHCSVCRKEDVCCISLDTLAVTVHGCFIFPFFEISIALQKGDTIYRNMQHKLR